MCISLSSTYFVSSNKELSILCFLAVFQKCIQQCKHLLHNCILTKVIFALKRELELKFYEGSHALVKPIHHTRWFKYDRD